MLHFPIHLLHFPNKLLRFPNKMLNFPNKMLHFPNQFLVSPMQCCVTLLKTSFGLKSVSNDPALYIYEYKISEIHFQKIYSQKIKCIVRLLTPEVPRNTQHRTILTPTVRKVSRTNLGASTWTKFDEFSENFRMGGGHFRSKKFRCGFFENFGAVKTMNFRKKGGGSRQSE